jgi:hypothetical protein
MSGTVSVKGGVTKSTFLYGPESHKLHLEFNIHPTADTSVIRRGMPVKLDKVTVGGADYDVVIPAAQNEDECNVIGISIHEKDSAYTGAIVVATRGYTVIYGQASGDMDAGAIVKFDGYDADTGYNKFAATAGVATKQIGWVLETCETGDIVQILIKN